jgi:hypothetical protein
MIWFRAVKPQRTPISELIWFDLGTKNSAAQMTYLKPIIQYLFDIAWNSTAQMELYGVKIAKDATS